MKVIEPYVLEIVTNCYRFVSIAYNIAFPKLCSNYKQFYAQIVGCLCVLKKNATITLSPAPCYATRGLKIMEIMTGYTDEQVRDLAQRPTPIMPGTWVLTSPDGKTWREDTPLKCVWAEQNDRIPPEVALARIKLAIPNGPDHPDGHDSDGFVGGCERMGCPGGDDCTSRTPLDLFALSASELSKIIIESRGEAYACQVVNELEAAL